MPNINHLADHKKVILTKGSYGSELLFKEQSVLVLKPLRSPFDTYAYKTFIGIAPEMLQSGVSNNSSGGIGGKTNLKNMRFLSNHPDKKFCSLIRGDGSKLVFQQSPKKLHKYLLHRDMQANGMKFGYFYNHELLENVVVLNPRDGNQQSVKMHLF